jgi:hypothetical protein
MPMIMTIIVYCEGFHAIVRSLKSDITQGNYEPFGEGCHLGQSLPHFWQNPTSLAVFLTLSFRIETCLCRLIEIFELLNPIPHEGVFGDGSCPNRSLPHFWHMFTFWGISLTLGFKNSNSFCKVFDLSFWALKSDIKRASYELFGEGTRYSRSLPHYRHILTFSAVYPTLSFRTPTILCHTIA